MTSVLDVARYIVQKQKSVTTMKLQKLCYYAQAWSLAWDDEPLFEEDFQAWANGPVAYELYLQHRGIFRVKEDFLKDEIENPNLDSKQIETIEAVLDYYGDKQPHWLSELTHKERPWKETRSNLPDGARSDKIIDKELMQEYYGGLMNE